MIKNDDDFLKSDRGGRDKEGKEERKMEYRETVNTRARQQIRRLILANFDHTNTFITLTFADNMQDIEMANYEFKKFIQKMKRRVDNFKFVAVIEFQKRGAIHYHMICNYILDDNGLHQNEKKLGKIWGNGFVDIQSIQDVDNVGAYLVKYMTKSGYDDRLEGKKRYFFSRKLIKPEILHGKDFIETLNKYKNEVPTFTSDYFSEFTGHVQYKEFNSIRNKREGL